MLRHPFLLSIVCVLGVTTACGTERSGAPAQPAPAARATSPARSEPPWPARAANTPRIVFLGDSLTAGLGLPVEQSYPSLIQARLDREGLNYEVVNAGVSGDTSAGGLRRLDWSLEGNVKILVVALGGNDGLRGLPPDELRRNLTTIIERARQRGIAVILAGMEAPPNNGPEYTQAFRATFAELARQPDVRFVPFLLQGVAGDNALNQADGIHPNAAGARILADTVWQVLEPAAQASATAPEPRKDR